MVRLIVHHLGVSQSDRVVWLCEELGLDYELKKYDRAPLLAPKEYKALHPIGSAPVIEYGDVKLAETEACVEFIAHTLGDGQLFVNPGEKGYADFLYWYHLGNGTLQPTISRCMTAEQLGASETDSAKRYRAKRDQILQYIDERLGQSQWLGGEAFSAADIMAVCSLTVMRSFHQYSLAGFQNILSYLKRVSQRPGYQRAMQRGDPDLEIERLIGADPPPSKI